MKSLSARMSTRPWVCATNWRAIRSSRNQRSFEAYGRSCRCFEWERPPLPLKTRGEIDFNTGPMPHVIATTRFVGTQYQKTKPGSKFNVEQIVIENSEDPNVP